MNTVARIYRDLRTVMCDLVISDFLSPVTVTALWYIKRMSYQSRTVWCLKEGRIKIPLMGNSG